MVWRTDIVILRVVVWIKNIIPDENRILVTILQRFVTTEWKFILLSNLPKFTKQSLKVANNTMNYE